MIVFPSVEDFKIIVQSANGIKNCPINIEDIKNAQTVYGKYLGTSTLKGKGTCSKPRVVINKYLKVPKEKNWEMKMWNYVLMLCTFRE